MHVLFVPYSVTIFHHGDYLWARNMGWYLDQLAGRFEEATILCHVSKTGNLTYFPGGQPLYAYSLSSVVHIIDFDAVNGPFRQVRLLLQRIRKADFIYLFLPSNKGLMGALLCNLFGKPYALYVGADWLTVAPFLVPKRFPQTIKTFLAWAILQLERFAVRRARFTITHGKSVVSRYGGEKNRVFNADPIMNWGKESFYERQDTCQGKTVKILYVGNLNPRKGIEYLIQGFAMARQQHPHLQLILVGAGESSNEQKLRTLADSLTLGDSIIFHGYVARAEDLFPLYREADIFLLPALGEGFPRVIYEAMSQGLPVIATALPTISAVLKDRDTALLIQPASPQAIARAVEELLRSAGLRQHLIKKGYGLARRKLIGNDPADQFKTLFSRYVLDGSRG